MKVLAVLAAAQFLMVLDQAVMNVSISQLVEDFDTDVTSDPGGHHALLAGDGRADDRRRQARRHHRAAARVRDRPRDLRRRLAAHRGVVERAGADAGLVGARGDRRRARAARAGGADRRAASRASSARSPTGCSAAWRAPASRSGRSWAAG